MIRKAGADLGFVRNSSALVILEKREDKYIIVHEREWIPVDKPLNPRQVIDEIVNATRNRQCGTICADIHYVADLSTQLQDTGVELMQFAVKPEEISRAWFVLKDLLAEGRLGMSKGSERLREQIQDLKFRPMPGGYFQIIQPEKQGAHGDVAQALIHALYAFGINDEGLAIGGDRRFSREDYRGDSMSMTLEEYLDRDPDRDQ